MFGGFLGVFVAAVVTQLDSWSARCRGQEERRTHPNIITPFHQGEGKTAFFICETDPHLTVHEQSMMQIYHSLLHTLFAAVDLGALLASFPTESVQSQQITIASLHDMLLGVVAVEGADIDEI